MTSISPDVSPSRRVRLPLRKLDDRPPNGDDVATSLNQRCLTRRLCSSSLRDESSRSIPSDVDGVRPSMPGPDQFRHGGTG